MQVLAHVHLIRKLRQDALAEMSLHVFLINHSLEFGRKVLTVQMGVIGLSKISEIKQCKFS